jgi:hypothetical protein
MLASQMLLMELPSPSPAAQATGETLGAGLRFIRVDAAPSAFTIVIPGEGPLGP